MAFQVIIIRYIHERFLYRLSQSPYNNKLFLKGGNFIYALQGLSARPTSDIDFLANEVVHEKVTILDIIKSIITIAHDEDGVWFDADTLKIEGIAERNQYNGYRVHLDAGFHDIKQTIQIDVGYGDSIVPSPVKMDFPVLLADSTIPQIMAYTPESVIAEKFQAMIVLSSFNSRMKDFYDVYILLKEHDIDDEKLQHAIEITFDKRNTVISKNPLIFTDEFKENEKRNIMWEVFLKKIKKEKKLSFKTVMDYISSRLETIIL